MTALFRIISPGPHTSVQDEGRFGYVQFGVPPSGALDPFASRVANALVGNPRGAAVLETTFAGPEVEILSGADVAVTGGEAPITLNGRPVPGWRSFRVRAGDRLKVGQVKTGCRNYIAVSGGIDVPLVMGSRSCYAAASLGGFKGRTLREGDVLDRDEGPLLKKPRALPQTLVPAYGPEQALRAVPGPQDDFFDTGMETFFASRFTVTPHTNRMGCRLEGPPIHRKDGMPTSIISEPSLPGSVQIPPDGKPIILLVEQTVGGYAKIATVISADIPKVAQAKPGDIFTFEKTSLEEAHRLFTRMGETLNW